MTWRVNIGWMEKQGLKSGSTLDLLPSEGEGELACACMFVCEKVWKRKLAKCQAGSWQATRKQTPVFSWADSCHLKQIGSTDHSLVLTHARTWTYTHTQNAVVTSQHLRSKQPFWFLPRLCLVSVHRVLSASPITYCTTGAMVCQMKKVDVNTFTGSSWERKRERKKKCAHWGQINKYI